MQPVRLQLERAVGYYKIHFNRRGEVEDVAIEFDSRAGQIEHSATNGSPPLRRLDTKPQRWGPATRSKLRRNSATILKIWFFLFESLASGGRVDKSPLLPLEWKTRVRSQIGSYKEWPSFPWNSSRYVHILCGWKRHLAGFPHLEVIATRSAPFKRVSVHLLFFRDNW